RAGLDAIAALRVMKAQRARRQFKRDPARFPRRELDLGEALELAHGPRAAGDALAHIKLCDLLALARADIDEIEGDKNRAVDIHGGARELHIAIGELRVAQPVAEGEQRLVRLVEIDGFITLPDLLRPSSRQMVV